MTTKTIPTPPQLETLTIEIDGEIGTLTLDRPDSLNAMSPELIFELTVASGWLADQAALRGLIVTGAGDRAFSSGGDVNWFKGGVDDPEIDLPANVRRGAEVLHQAIVDFRRIPYPVIAAVNGVAAGAGFSLALMCDIRIASSDAAFVCAYGRIGASPDGGMTYFLPRASDRRRPWSCCSTTLCCPPKTRSRWGSSPRSCPPASCSPRPGRRPRSWPRSRPTTCAWRSC
jgi:enoyl-CoA hydratase/carnithine racemase